MKTDDVSVSLPPLVIHMYWIHKGYINKVCFYFGRLRVICQWNTVVLQQKECLTQRWKLRKTSGEGLHRSQVLKNEKPFAKYGRAGRKGRKKGNLNRGNSSCKGTRLLTLGKGMCSGSMRSTRSGKRKDSCGRIMVCLATLVKKVCFILWVLGGWLQYTPFMIRFLTKNTMKKIICKVTEKLMGSHLPFSQICHWLCICICRCSGGPHSCHHPIFLELVMSERLWTWCRAFVALCSLTHTQPFS